MKQTVVTRLHWLIVSGAILMGCAVFDFTWRNALLTGSLLLLPFFDKSWKQPTLKFKKSRCFLWSILTIGTLLIAVVTEYKNFVLSTLLLTALPEEWYFRAYFMRTIQSLGQRAWFANIVSSTLFTLLHIPTQGWIGLSIFFPSLFYGYLYQRTNDLILIILLHTLSNLLFIIFFEMYY